MDIKIVQPGVDPNRVKPENCQDCATRLDEESVDTCSIGKDGKLYYITLCRLCYLKAGNTVR